MSDNKVGDYELPSDFVRPKTVEEAENQLQKLTFPDGFTCYAHSGSSEVELLYNEIIVKQEYFQQGLSVMGASCVMDIGANVGIFTMAAKLKAPQATVYAFEPMPETFRVLEQNARSLESADIHIFNVAIGSQDRVEETFTYFPYMSGNSTNKPALKVDQKLVMDEMFGKEMSDFMNQTETCVVQVRTLSSIIREQGITSVDFLKIDVEGSEISVFEGIEEAHWPIFKQVAIETHTPQLREQACEILIQHGFEVHIDLGMASQAGVSLVHAHRA